MEEVRPAETKKKIPTKKLKRKSAHKTCKGKETLEIANSIQKGAGKLLGQWKIRIN